LEVISKENKEENENREFMKQNKDIIKYKSSENNIDKRIKALKNNNYKSNFNIKIGSYE